MANLNRSTAILALLALLLVGAHAQTDCSKPANPKDFQACCKIPEPKFDAYTQQCPKLKDGLKAQKDPCSSECVFNASQALQNGQLNMDNVRTMLAAIFPDNADFSQAFALGFDKCQTEVQQKAAEFKASGRAKPAGFGNCSPLPVMYAMCAHRNVFVNCPATAWTASAVCDQAKDYATNCDNPRGMGKGGRRGGGGGGGGAGGGAGGGGGGGGRKNKRMGSFGMSQGAGVDFHPSAFF